MAKKADKEARSIKLRKRNLELERNVANLTLALYGSNDRLDAQAVETRYLRALAGHQRAILRRRNARLAAARHGRLRHLWIHLRAWRRGFRHRGHRARQEEGHYGGPGGKPPGVGYVGPSV